MDGNGPLIDDGEPVGMTGHILHVLAQGGILEHGVACDLAHSAGLNDRVAQVGSLDELGALQEQAVGVRGDQQPAACGGHADGGLLSACIHDVGVDGLFGQGGGIAEGSACSGQLHGAVRIHLQAQRVTGAVQAVSNQIAGNALCIETIDDLIHGFVVVDVDGEVGGVTAGLLCTLGLVVVVHHHLGVTDGNLDGTCLGAALVAVVADHADFLHQRLAQLEVDQIGIADLCFMCHKNILSLIRC